MSNKTRVAKNRIVLTEKAESEVHLGIKAEARTLLTSMKAAVLKTCGLCGEHYRGGQIEHLGVCSSIAGIS